MNIQIFGKSKCFDTKKEMCIRDRTYGVQESLIEPD